MRIVGITSKINIFFYNSFVFGKMEYMKHNILGVPIDAVTMDEALAMAGKMLSNGRQNIIFTPNPEILLEASRDDEYRAVLQRADLALPDGAGLVLFGRFLGALFRGRVAGVDFMVKLCELSAKHRQKVFFLGGKNGATERTAAVLKKQFPALQVAGWSEEVDLPRPSLCNADILFVALGAQKQERWICDNLSRLPSVKIAMAVGGEFDMISGDIPRAPIFLRKIGLEWLWRFALEPKKRWKRVFNAVIVFPIKILISKFIIYLARLIL